MTELFDFFTKKKFCKDTRQDRDDLKIWEDTWKSIQDDLETLMKHNMMAACVVVGLDQYGAMKRMASRESGRVVFPKTLNGIPVVLVSCKSYCEVVPSNDDLFRAISD